MIFQPWVPMLVDGQDIPVDRHVLLDKPNLRMPEPGVRIA